ncbi:Cobalamin synthase [Vibrio aerogenes CECT 7868]|uniref:Adenosylcobinamide-GDP ribazoletransferase n=1 Tax=Vibrio aerogenes CECT 7868 TaxID=1216006 RepID=A0A1M5ZUA7_9VIBR|nr:adenosylcobinamide-GDP ribazoletransferase [Vibrio aerogenes]SHI27867.1 Cobalamin synthase [Vibrio aerogenes CECT 7868]
MFARLKYQLELFWLSLSFFSRIPVPRSTPYSEVRMNQSSRYFSAVGLCIGALCLVIFWLMARVVPEDIAVFCMMCFSLMLTGAFHEDGLADMADGIGGGMTVEKRLNIMKDSRIGTYGTASLMMALLGKYLLLTHLAASAVFVPVVLLGHSLSRVLAGSVIFDTPYVTDLNQSKSKPLASEQATKELVILSVIGLIPVIFLPFGLSVILIVLCLGLRSLFRRWLISRLGGFTGDTLGGIQQCFELFIYLFFLACIHLGLNVQGG